MSNTDDLNLTADEQFFFDHAGWSHDPLTESPREGRVRCAQALATAEQWLKDNSAFYRVTWEDDPDSRYDHGRDVLESSPETCEQATLWMIDADHPWVAASLGCIDDADDAYRRVVAAELALEVKP